jgi:hypothetical protein
MTDDKPTLAQVEADMVAQAASYVARLVAMSGELYTVWEADAAFYALRAAADVALTEAQLQDVKQIAIRRRDEFLQAEQGVTAANHGARTLDCPLTEDMKQRGYRDSYAVLVADLDRAIRWRQGEAYDWLRKAAERHASSADDPSA